ncbi:hypothetical protein MIR68_007122 [Amoeboaphelidium protococcarum]|nr:hypothetical protein MIR68_007122 [Amoeboaphelidium protococcarum]
MIKKFNWQYFNAKIYSNSGNLLPLSKCQACEKVSHRSPGKRGGQLCRDLDSLLQGICEERSHNGLLTCAAHITKATQNQWRLKAAGLDDYALIDSQFMLFRSPLNPLLEHCSKMLSDFTGGKFNASQCKDVFLKVDLPWQQSASVDFLLNGPCGIVCLELDHEYHRSKMFGFPDPRYRHLSRHDPDVELCRMLAVSTQLFKATGKKSACCGLDMDFNDLDASILKITTALDDLSTFLALGNNNTKVVKLEYLLISSLQTPKEKMDAPGTHYNSISSARITYLTSVLEVWSWKVEQSVVSNLSNCSPY